jgi:predicted  nucleic acid-binding Zn-ribbon protein
VIKITKGDYIKIYFEGNGARILIPEDLGDLPASINELLDAVGITSLDLDVALSKPHTEAKMIATSKANEDLELQIIAKAKRIKELQHENEVLETQFNSTETALAKIIDERDRLINKREELLNEINAITQLTEGKENSLNTTITHLRKETTALKSENTQLMQQIRGLQTQLEICTKQKQLAELKRVKPDKTPDAPSTTPQE